ncbi:hypothetical protein [Synechococcus sp. W4D4]|uniref:hypothetical protein n=1 Tax=Synechococcus sp. W4D4 TaxID=3392294 RepID=UPI0039ED0A96
MSYTAKILLNTLSPYIVYSNTVSISEATFIVFILSTFGYLDLLAPGRPVYAIKRYNKQIFKSSTVEKQILLSKSAFSWASQKWFLLVLAPVIAYGFSLLFGLGLTTWIMPIGLICGVMIAANFMLGFNFLVYALGEPSFIYRKQIPFAIASICFLTISVVLSADRSCSANSYCANSLGILFWLLAWIIFGGGLVYSSLQARKKLIGEGFLNKSKLSTLSGVGWLRECIVKERESYSLREFLALPAINSYLNMLSLGLSPFALSFLTKEIDYKSAMTLLPLFSIWPAVAGSLFYVRTYRDFQVSIHSKREFSSKSRQYLYFYVFVMAMILGACLVIILALKGLNPAYLGSASHLVFVLMIAYALIQVPQLYLAPQMYAQSQGIKVTFALTLTLVLEAVLVALMMLRKTDQPPLNMIGFLATLFILHLSYNIVLFIEQYSMNKFAAR